MLRIAFAVLALAAAMPAMAVPDGPSVVLDRFMAAWSRSDAKGIAALFAPDADFVNPTGAHATGREAIAAFYGMAFTHGYAGSRGLGEVVSERPIGPELVLVDGHWSIEGAKTETGAARPPERGILAAVLRKTAQGWEIVALRESASATEIADFPPKT